MRGKPRPRPPPRPSASAPAQQAPAFREAPPRAALPRGAARGRTDGQGGRRATGARPLVVTCVTRGPSDVPTLFRFLAVVAILAGLAFAAMFALATFVEPTPREISVTIPNAKLQPK